MSRTPIQPPVDEITKRVSSTSALGRQQTFDRRAGWNDGGTQSCAHWLNWKCGISFCAAREKVRTARALENLPKIAGAMERGEISYSKVRELTRVACPATEDNLLTIAVHGTAHHVEQLVRYYRHVDMETLQSGCAGRCEIEHGTHIAAQTARCLACDASVVGIVEDENGDPLSVGRKTRSVPPALHRALRSRDKGCRFPGCCNTRYTDAHHIHHWAHGGETKLSNLVTLCRFHHRAVHEGKVEIHILDDGAIRFLKPTGERFDSIATGHNHPMSDWRELPQHHDEQGIAITPRTATTRWDGGPMDFGMAIDTLLYRVRQANNPPRGGSESTSAA